MHMKTYPAAAGCMSQLSLLDELRWRGLVHLTSESLEARLAQGPVSGYIGFDASATSLHVGHLLESSCHAPTAGGGPSSSSVAGPA
jgi:hypothetical protein